MSMGFLGFLGFTCCGRDGCGTGTKASSVTVLPRKTAVIYEPSSTAVEVRLPRENRNRHENENEDMFTMVENELSENYSENLPSKSPRPLPRWGSFSVDESESDEDVTTTPGGDKPFLERVALSLKASAAKTRQLAEQRPDLLPSLRAAEHNCAAIASKHKGHAKGNVHTAPQVSQQTTTIPHIARDRVHSEDSTASTPKTAAKMQHTIEPAGIHKHAMDGEISDSDGDVSDSGGVDTRYNTQKVSTIIQALRLKMENENIEPPRAQLSRSPAVRHRQIWKPPQHSTEVQNYQAVMRSKFEALGVSEAQTEEFVKTTCPSVAVRDAVAKYHTHCRATNNYYAMVGEEPGGLRVEDRRKLDVYVQDLQNEGHKRTLADSY